MKLICTREKFKKAIFNLERVVSKQNTLPILNNILFETEKGIFKLSATNLEIGVIIKISAKIEKEGKITIPAKLIGNFIANLPSLGENNITLEAVDQSLKIKSGYFKATIKGLPADDFPLIPQKTSDFLINIPSFIFKKAITKIITCVGYNETRQELTGVNMILNPQGFFLAATDSFRLAESQLKLNNENINKEAYEMFIKSKNNIIIPSATLLELSRIIQNEAEEGAIKITIENSQIFFDLEGIKIVSRLINGKYPEYKNIIPKEFKTTIQGEKELIQGVVKMASVFTSGRSGEVGIKINSDEKKVVFEARSVEIGENSSELKLEITGPSQEIIFNSKYLLEGLNTLNTPRIALLINSGSSPAALKEVNMEKETLGEDYIYIIMPIKN
ncbi:MAG: DNA polymerase III subunit beta [Candidatus Moranbacteria bacterium CG06_land_8_20_14_3_00_40_12]|nr:MAG: DNA polymerase III subunit beta [Candidatus Moranbacteria bacterium CG23_combo_of_CG06-09_8_20_14_all_40_16]PIU80984.1 MAG: DNA polymerase III subunit beta [Candidatus Moranbacteria bacterium CG06_land_8_20_14_3_00_40_12]